MKTLKELAKQWVLTSSFATFGEISAHCRKRFPYELNDCDIDNVLEQLIKENIITKYDKNKFTSTGKEIVE